MANSAISSWIKSVLKGKLFYSKNTMAMAAHILTSGFSTGDPALLAMFLVSCIQCMLLDSLVYLLEHNVENEVQVLVVFAA